jgi:hypothetical protein
MPEEQADPDSVKPAPEPRQKDIAKAEQKPLAKDEKKTPQEQKKVSDILQSVHIALDNYDDIFSDFDPSPYETRILSDDFLNELHRHYVETPKGAYAITFTLPHAFRSEKKETLIKKRIKDYFKGRLKDLDKSMADRWKRGVTRAFIGVVISLSVLLIPVEWHTFAAALISPLLWYLMWTGFESIFDVSRKMRKKRAFVEKILKAEYMFRDEESVVGEALQYAESSYR